MCMACFCCSQDAAQLVDLRPMYSAGLAVGCVTLYRDLQHLCSETAARTLIKQSVLLKLRLERESRISNCILRMDAGATENLTVLFWILHC